MPLTVHTLWSPGSYGDQTRLKIFPDSTADFAETNGDIVESVIQRNGIGIIPVSNPYWWFVHESWEALEKHRSALIIASSHTIPIDHAVIRKIEYTHREVKKIFTHPQAYQQSKCVLDDAYPGHEFVATRSTTEALTKITEHSVAICSAQAIRLNPALAQLYQIVREHISPADNATKFLVIATKVSINAVLNLSPSQIDVLHMNLRNRVGELALKIGLITLLGGNIHEWTNKKTSPGKSPLYSALFITSRLSRNFLAKKILSSSSICPIRQKEDLSPT